MRFITILLTSFVQMSVQQARRLPQPALATLMPNAPVAVLTRRTLCPELALQGAEAENLRSIFRQGMQIASRPAAPAWLRARDKTNAYKSN